MSKTATRAEREYMDRVAALGCIACRKHGYLGTPADKEFDTGEEWVVLHGWDGFYEISTLGRVRSMQRLTKLNKVSNKYPSKILKPIVAKNGYLVVNLTGGGKRKQILVHSAVLQSFIGPAPLGMEACHENGNRTDARLSNLRWDTRKGNHADKKKHGTWQGGENNPASKLTAEQAMQIKAAKGTLQIHALAKKFGVSNGCAEKVNYGSAWGHLNEKG